MLDTGAPHHLPFPEAATDPPNGAAQIQALAERLHGRLAQFVTELPDDPDDQQEVIYRPVADFGPAWHLRYDASQTGLYKWHFLGGGHLYAYDVGSSYTVPTDTSEHDDPDLLLPAPLAGFYEAEAGAVFASPGVTGVYGLLPVGQALGGSEVIATNTTITGPIIVPRRQLGITVAGTNVALRYKRSTGTGTLQRLNGWLSMQPLLVG